MQLVSQLVEFLAWVASIFSGLTQFWHVDAHLMEKDEQEM